MKRLAIITTHPIQYYAPVFKLLAKAITLKVFYTGGEQLINQFDRGFNKKIEWDLPLLDGYDYQFLENSSADAGTHHFKGIVNPKGIQRINEFKPNAILIYGWAFSSHLKIIRFFSGKIPLYFRGDSTLMDDKPTIRTLLKRVFLTWVYRHIDVAFYVGEKNRAYFEHFGLANRQLIFAPHAIDNDRFSNDETDALAVRKQFKLNNDDVLILFAGKLEAKKNPALLLNTFFDLNLSKAHLLFVGNGPLESKLKAEIEGHKAKDNRVHFMDFQNQTQMPAIYQSCDLFCLPSKGPGETWGLAVNEAMAAGKAILISDKVGCSTDLLKPGLNGEIFNTEKAEDFRNKLINMLGDKTRLVHYGEASKKIIQDWSFEKQVNSFLEVFNS
ncbi:glycosyl transferase family 1 [Pedobacter yonginense]|uniref:Glycosyl transferase family 1 n=1 Tax=Pedobacter yonginense TaxID=651869 RepID=A0A317EJ87_9SPHI|nr:glycosyltransferase family 4 protein [Pedobacter yonginense]PWS26385.1 glycosyl transferase family 1 [Pedobacter yonginense]